MKEKQYTPAIRWTHILIFLVVILLAIIVAETISQGLYSTGETLQLQAFDKEQHANIDLHIL